MSKLIFLSKTKNSVSVYYDPDGSHAATHFSDTPSLKELVIEVLQTAVVTKEKEWLDTDMGRIVGTTDEVENSPGDKIIYAKRKNRDIYTSFNKSKLPQPSSRVSVALNKEADGSYELVSCWIGHFHSPPFPGDKNETPNSKEYWTHHSLIWGSQEIVAESETTTCPW